MQASFLKYFILALLLSACSAPTAQDLSQLAEPDKLEIGNQRTAVYFPLIENKNLAIVANHTSYIEDTHLVDSLLSGGMMVKKIFAPEHGFRGTADAGEAIVDGIDQRSGLPVVSLYGKNKKPSAEQLSGIDIIVFDIQDVGVRFYTYISTLSYVMEAAAELDIKVIVLDRTNPHAHYTDGPMMEEKYSSFVGLHVVPVVYGMTIGEYATMVNGEKWLAGDKPCELEVIPCANYDRNKRYEISIAPSPNLPDARSIQLYPSLCFFEGTTFNEGRGTDKPFQCYGHPSYTNLSFAYMPKANIGSKYPKFKDEKVYGKSLVELSVDTVFASAKLNLSYIQDAHQNFEHNAASFFLDNNFLEKLTGTLNFREQIKEGRSEHEMRDSWENDLKDFEETRRKYLIY